MKKFIIHSFLALIVMAIGIIACEDEPASGVRELTEEEKRQQEILDSLKNLVNADTFFVYDVLLPLDSVAYRNVEVQHDSDLLASALGFNSADALRAALGSITDGAQVDNTVKWNAINGSTGYDYTEAYTANGIGFWWDANGDVTSWDGAEGGVSVFYNENNTDTWITYVGQFPGRLTIGNEHTLINLLQNADDYRVALIFNVTVGDYYTEPPYEDPETAPSGAPVAVDKAITVSHAYAADWSSNSVVDVKEVLRDAFKMTTYQIYQAIIDKELVFKGINSDGSVYEDADGNIVSTANYPGHWFDVDGDVTVWGDTISTPAVYSEIGYDKELLEMRIGHHPENVSSGTSVSYKQKAELNGGSVTFTVNLTIE